MALGSLVGVRLDGVAREVLASAQAGSVVPAVVLPIGPQLRTLYVRRDVLNADEIIAWAKAQGFTSTLPANDMHVTVAFSKQPVNWAAAGRRSEPLNEWGGPRKLQAFGPEGDAIVLQFESGELHKRWEELLGIGASWDWPEYHPHLTITYSKPPELVLGMVEPFKGMIQLGPEVFAEVKAGWASDIKENAVAPVAIDYAQIGRDLDALEAQTKKDLREVLIEWRDGLTRKVEKASKGDGLAKLAESLRLPRRGDFTTAMTEALRRAWAKGQADARAEVQAARRRAREHAFNPNQPRHPKGDPKGGEWLDVYHGTAEEYAKQIVKEGLTVQKELRINSGALYKGRRGQSVFVTTDKNHAMSYAISAAYQHALAKDPGRTDPNVWRQSIGSGWLKDQNGKPVSLTFGRYTGVVIHFRVPREVAKQFTVDGHDMNSLYKRGSLDAKYAVGYTTVRHDEETGKNIVRTKKLADDGLLDIYAAVIIRMEEERRKFSEAQDERLFAASTFTPRAALRWLGEKAFWITSITGDRLLNEARGVILQSLKTGRPLAETILALAEVFAPYIGGEQIGDEKQAEPYRLETIIRTNTTDAYNHGRLTDYVSKDMIPFLDGVRYSSILDERTTEVCRFLHGKVFKPKEKALEELLPPNHFNCRSIVVPIVVGEAVNDSEWITAEEIAEAKLLADAKFLSLHVDAWKAYREKLAA